MTITILGWGSLVWDPQGLPVNGDWQLGGPTLPIEFSRISGNGRLTLVIDEQDGVPVVTRYASSPRARLAHVVGDLRRREGTQKKYIGFISVAKENARSQSTIVTNSIREWAVKTGVSGVVWTDLPPNFRQKTGSIFTPGSAEVYLRGLENATHELARTYIANAPVEVDTPLRRHLAGTGWM